MIRTTLAVGIFSISVVSGCGDDSTSDTDAGRIDGGRADGGMRADAQPVDAQLMDTSVPDGELMDTSVPDGELADTSVPDTSTPDAPFDGGPIDMITVTGLIEGEDTGAGAPPIAGATVSIHFPSGAMLASATTAADGTYSVTSAANMLMLIRVAPLTDYLGVLRAEVPQPADYAAYGLRLPYRPGVVGDVEDAGSTYDPATGLLVAGYNPVTVADGGEGATLGGVTHDPAFVLYPGGLLVTNILPRICGSGETPAVDMCALTGRNDQVTFPNIVGSPVTVTIIDPAGGTCVERFGVASWPVFPDTLINVNIDCTAS